MKLTVMGKVIVSAKIENLADLNKVWEGELAADQVRRVEVTDALIDTGATMLSLPIRLIQQLGLRRQRTKTAQTSAGVFSFGIYGTVRLTVQERDCVIEVAELPDGCPPLIGQIPLEMLDFVVDLKNRCLIGNPDHGGENMIDMF
jgi:predicted aspartyl protease